MNEQRRRERVVTGFYRGCPKCDEPILNWQVYRSWDELSPWNYAELNEFYGFCVPCNVWVLVHYKGAHRSSRYRSKDDYEMTIRKP